LFAWKRRYLFLSSRSCKELAAGHCLRDLIMTKLLCILFIFLLVALVLLCLLRILERVIALSLTPYGWTGFFLVVGAVLAFDGWLLGDISLSKNALIGAGVLPVCLLVRFGIAGAIKAARRSARKRERDCYRDVFFRKT
jgi:hypothetical protein